MSTPAFNSAGMTMSSTFHHLAKKALERAELHKESGNVFVEKDCDRHYSYYALEAVVLSVTAAEAGINECANFLEVGWMPNVLMPADFLRLQLRVKWSLLPIIVAGATFDRGTAPWQDFHALIALRDSLVHFKFGLPPPAFMEHLRSRKLTLQSPHENAPFDWVAASLTNQTARWAVNTVADMFAKLAEFCAPKCLDPSIWFWGSSMFPRV